MKYYPRYLALFLVAISLFYNNAYASRVYAHVYYEALSVPYIGIPEEASTGQVSSFYPDIGRAHTSLGHATATVDAPHLYRGIARVRNSFRIDDLRLSYIGEGAAQSTVRGSAHLTYTANVFHGQAFLSLGFDIGKLGHGSGYEYQNFDNAGHFRPIGNGVFERSRNFEVGESFSLAFNGAMTIAAQRDEGWVVDGTYSVVLGGSPVFNLPEGYVVNSADGRIVNNWYTGLGAPSAVPIPAAIWLMGSGLIGLLGVRRKKV